MIRIFAIFAMLQGCCDLPEPEPCKADESIECWCIDRVSIRDCNVDAGAWGECRCSEPATGCGRYPLRDSECNADRPFLWNCAPGEAMPIGCGPVGDADFSVCCPYNG